ncbi:MAG: hypothetical protein IJ282_10195 [Lachnospiraceae bacterium]|nr:hypothetical protein [Lachnospiraceae bacterium]
MPAPTQKIYYEDPHITDFTATVLSCEIDIQTGNLLLTLDKSAFFPEEGGQKADTGTINGLPVLDVQIKNEILTHVLPAGAADSLSVGDTVTGHVDWSQRFDFMQQHSGEHILSGLAHSHYGCNNVGFHLGYEEVTLDFDKVLNPEQVRELEKEVNRVIQMNLPVFISFPSKEDLSAMDYRSKIEIQGDVRIVEIPGVDVCACCAPHVDFTGQIGLLKVTSLQNHRGGVRLNILCGMRAIADYTNHQNYVTDVSVLLSAKPEKIGDAVRRLKEESQGRQERINSLQAKLLSQRLAALPDTIAGSQEPLILFEDKMDAKALRDAVNVMTEKYSGYCGLFSGSDEEGYFYIIGSKDMDCRNMANLLREKFGAKGGGSALMVQGTVVAPKDILAKIIKNC